MTVDRRSGRGHGAKVCFFAIAMGAAAVKILDVFLFKDDLAEWQRQAGVVVAAVAFAFFTCRSPGTSLARFWRPAVLGLWPARKSARLPDIVATRSPAADWGWARAVLGLGAASLAVVAATDWVEGRTRWMVLGSGLVLWLGLAGWEIGRQRAAGALDDYWPDRATLWSVSPLVLAAVGAAAVLALDHRGSQLLTSTPDGGSFLDIELVRLLLLTAFAEELIFRGALLAAAYRIFSRFWAEVFTAASFGLWHVADALQDRPEADALEYALAVAGTVAVTTVGGLVFAVLRHRTRWLGGSVLAHTATNLPGLALAAP